MLAVDVHEVGAQDALARSTAVDPAARGVRSGLSWSTWRQTAPSSIRITQLPSLPLAGGRDLEGHVVDLLGLVATVEEGHRGQIEAEGLAARRPALLPVDGDEVAAGLGLPGACRPRRRSRPGAGPRPRPCVQSTSAWTVGARCGATSAPSSGPGARGSPTRRQARVRFKRASVLCHRRPLFVGPKSYRMTAARVRNLILGLIAAVAARRLRRLQGRRARPAPRASGACCSATAPSR